MFKFASTAEVNLSRQGGVKIGETATEDIDEQDLEQLFHMIDQDQSGTIEVSEFIGPLSLGVCRSCASSLSLLFSRFPQPLRVSIRLEGSQECVWEFMKIVVPLSLKKFPWIPMNPQISLIIPKQIINPNSCGVAEHPRSRWAHDSKTAPRFIKYNMIQATHLEP